MRACATAGAVFAGLTFAAALFGACTTLQPTTSAPDTTPTEAPGAAAAPAPAAGGPAAPGGNAAAKKPPETVADCKEIVSEITNDPPSGGVVMNNAMTSADAGSSDRLQPILDVVNAKRDGFRCCFDLYARKNPGAQGRLAFTMKLKPDGSLIEAHIKKDESDVTAPEIESCMTELAKGITWPESPSAKETTYTHRFNFKRR